MKRNIQNNYNASTFNTFTITRNKSKKPFLADDQVTKAKSETLLQKSAQTLENKKLNSKKYQSTKLTHWYSEDEMLSKARQ